MGLYALKAIGLPTSRIYDDENNQDRMGEIENGMGSTKIGVPEIPELIKRIQTNASGKAGVRDLAPCDFQAREQQQTAPMPAELRQQLHHLSAQHPHRLQAEPRRRLKRRCRENRF